jgi:hypothetical protein
MNPADAVFRPLGLAAATNGRMSALSAVSQLLDAPPRMKGREAAAKPVESAHSFPDRRRQTMRRAGGAVRSSERSATTR